MHVVFDQFHSSEFVHKVSNARPRRAYHFGQGLVTESGYCGIGPAFVFAQAYELQENPSQPLLAKVEKLVAEILFEVDIAL